MTERPIFLAGFMGSGKTTVGRALATALGWEFIDLDELIVEREGRPIAEIFRTDGEAHFRQLESAALGEAAARQRTVIALGGGTFVTETNRRLIAAGGTSIFLDCPFETLLARVGSDPSRPLNRSPEQLRQLLEQRLPIYRTAQVQVTVGGLSPAECVQKIIAAVGG